MGLVIRTLLILAAGLVLLPGRAAGQCEIFSTRGNTFDLLGDSVGVHADWLVYTQRQTVRVMRWTGAAWVPHTDLSLPNTVRAVDVSDDVIVAGVLGDMSLRIFRFNGVDWVPEATLYDRWSPSFLQSRTLDLHGDLLICSNSLPADGDAWVYRYTGGQWTQEYTSAARWDAVATDGERFMLGNQSSFWIFAHDGSNWFEEYAWSPSHIGGRRVDLSGSIAIASRPPTPDDGGLLRVYRPCDGHPQPWCEDAGLPIGHDGDIAVLDGVLAQVEGHQLELHQDLSGEWDSFDLLSASGANEAFGYIVEMDGEWIVVGAPGDDTNGQDSGSVYVFRRDATYVATEPFAFELGTCRYPHDTIQEGLAALGPSHVLVVAAGTYAEAPLVLDAPVSMTAAGGTVRID